MTIQDIKHPSRLALSGKSGWAYFILHTEEHPYLLLHSLYTVNDIYAFKMQAKGREKEGKRKKSLIKVYQSGKKSLIKV